MGAKIDAKVEEKWSQNDTMGLPAGPEFDMLFTVLKYLLHMGPSGGAPEGVQKRGREPDPSQEPLF